MKNKVLLRFLRLSFTAILLAGMLAAPGGSVQAAPNAPVNGDFEQGRNVGWQESSSNGYEIVWNPAAHGGVPAPAHGGSWMAYLGGDDLEISSVKQSITVAPNTRMSFWYWIESGDDCGFDIGFVSINSITAHNFNLCEAQNTGGWVNATVDVTAFAAVGQTTTLEFYVSTDESFPSGLLIDDVVFYDTFVDVSITDPFLPYIRAIYNDGITSGCSTSPLMYCPTGTVTRAQMAVFLLRGSHGSSYSPPAVGGSTGFGDVPTTYWAAAWIKQLVTEGITSGCGTGTYCPDSPVTRGQMAVFLSRTFGIP